jgi:hypothetical protein
MAETIEEFGVGTWGVPYDYRHVNAPVRNVFGGWGRADITKRSAGRPPACCAALVW